MQAQKKYIVRAADFWAYRLLCLGLLSVALILGIAPTAWSFGSKADVKIAVLALRGDAEALKTWGATAAYLGEMIPGHSFTVVPYDFKTIGSAAQRGEYDFVIANSSIYVELEALYGVTRIATLKGLNPGRAATLFGGVVLCKSDRADINGLKDLKRKTFLAVDETSFGGWRMAWRELQAAGLDPYRDFHTLGFAGTHDAVVYAVRDGKVDAGTVRSGILEEMATEGKIRLEDFKIVNQKSDEGFDLFHSTRLYPEWPFARLRQTDDSLAQKVVIALLSMESGHEAAKAAKSAGWTTPRDYTDIHELFKELKIDPYKEYGKITLAMVFDKYRYAIVGGVTFISLLIVFAVFMLRLNDKLNRSNVALAEAHRKLKAAQSQLLQGEKMASIGQLAAGVAHEINNPVGFIHSNLSTLGKYLGRFAEYTAAQQAAAVDLAEDVQQRLAAKAKELKIDYITADAKDLIRECLEGTDRVKEITMNLKNFSRVDNQAQQAANLNTCLDETLRIVWNELKYKATVIKEYGDLPETVCYPQQLNQVFVNILVNAAQAMVDKGEIRIRTWAAEDAVFIAISDTGPGIPAAIRHRLFEPFFTTKEVGKGTGLGLSISYDIVKKHDGEITIDSEEGRGTIFTVQIPIRDMIETTREAA